MFALLLLPAAGESLAQTTSTLTLSASGPDGTIYVEEMATTVITVTAEYVETPPSLTTTGLVAPTGATTVTVAVAGGLTLAGPAIVSTEYTAVSDFEIIIPAGSISMTGTFMLVAADVGSGGKTLLVTATATGFTAVTSVADGAGVVWIANAAGSQILDVSLDPTSVREDSGIMTIMVTAARPAVGDAFASATTLTIAVAAGTASATDFTTVADFEIMVPAGVHMVTGSFSLTVTDNALVNSDKTLTVSSTGASITNVRHRPATLTITDDEVAASGIALSLSPAAVVEGSGATTITVTAAAPAGSLLASAATVTVARAAGTDAGTAVGSAADADPLGDFSPAALSPVEIALTAGASSMTGTFVLTVNDNTAAAAAKTLVLSGTTTAINPTTGVAFVIDNETLTITDDEVAASGIALSLDQSSVSEDSGMTTITVTATAEPAGSRLALEAIVTVTLDTAASTATLSMAATGETAAVPGDFTLSGLPATITLAADSSSMTETFVLTVVDDEDPERDKTLVLSGTTAAINPTTTAAFAIANLTLTIVDNDGGASESMEAVLPELARVSVTSVIDVLSGRIAQVASGSLGDGSVSFAGHSSLAQALAANQQGLNDGDLSLLEALGGSSIALDLDGTGTAAPSAGGQAGSSGVGVWASANYDRISSTTPGGDDWDGNQFSLFVGVDGHVSRNTVIGVAASWSKGSTEFDDDPTLDIDTGLLGLNPYIGWHSADGRKTAWGTVGYSSGDFEQDQLSQPIKTDLKMTVLAVGGSTRLAERAGLDFDIKGDLSTAELSTDATTGAAEVKSKAHRARVAVEAEVNKASDSGGHVMRSVALGLRYDGGDGDTGSGLELDGGLDWSGRSVSVSGAANVLLFHTGDLKEWGLGGLIRYEPSHAKGRNLTFRAQPSYGPGESGSGQLWDQQVKDLDEGGEPEARLVMDAGWGLAALSGRGLVTPYSGLELSEGGSRIYRLGSRVAVDSIFNIDLAANRTEDGDSPEHGIGLQLGMQW